MWTLFRKPLVAIATKIDDARKVRIVVHGISTQGVELIFRYITKENQWVTIPLKVAKDAVKEFERQLYGKQNKKIRQRITELKNEAAELKVAGKKGEAGKREAIIKELEKKVKKLDVEDLKGKKFLLTIWK